MSISKETDVGTRIYGLAKEIFPICRSITGEGVLQTYNIINRYIKDSGYQLSIMNVNSGEDVFDWQIPKEWRINEAFIEDENHNHIVDFKENNLHLMGYSAPVDRWLSLDEMKQYIYTEPSQPDVIPYVTSYYKERYGFCMSQNQLNNLPDDKYHLFIDSKLFYGKLTYAEVFIPGDTDNEIFFSTYTCHPSMGNDNCSGICLQAEMINYVASLSYRRYSYRFIFIPETIGSITYISRNLAHMKEYIFAGFNLSCVGDDNDYSIIHSIHGNTISDKVLSNVLKYKTKHTEYPYIKRASDERQYNAPGVELPIVGFCRSKYDEFPEYHTSADNLDFISKEGFDGSFEALSDCVDILEKNLYYKLTVICEPQLGKRGLYPTVSHKGTYDDVQAILDTVAFADGKRDLIDISNEIGVPAADLIPIVEKLREHHLLEGNVNAGV